MASYLTSAGVRVGKSETEAGVWGGRVDGMCVLLDPEQLNLAIQTLEGTGADVRVVPGRTFSVPRRRLEGLEAVEGLDALPVV